MESDPLHAPGLPPLPFARAASRSLYELFLTYADREVDSPSA